jgi:hypothetical protein
LQTIVNEIAKRKNEYFAKSQDGFDSNDFSQQQVEVVAPVLEELV